MKEIIKFFLYIFLFCLFYITASTNLFRNVIRSFFQNFRHELPTFSPDAISPKVPTPAFKADFLACLINF